MCPGAQDVFVRDVLRDDHTVRKWVWRVIATQPKKHQRDRGIKFPVSLEQNVYSLVRAECSGEHDVLTCRGQECGPGRVDGLEAVIGYERWDHINSSLTASGQ